MAPTEHHRDATELAADLFEKAAASYETRMGGSSRRVARHLIQLLRPLGPQAIVLDNAAGTGAVTEELLAASQPSEIAKVHAVDRSSAMISMIQQGGVGEHVEAAVMDGQDLQFDDDTFDVSITLAGIFFFPDPVAGAKEIYRTLKPGARAAVTSWVDVGVLPLFYEAQSIVKPVRDIESLPGAEEWLDVEKLRKTMKAGGFEDIQISEYATELRTKTEEDMVNAMTMHITSYAGGIWSDAEKGRVPGAVAKLLNERQDMFLVDEAGNKSVKMVAGLALCTK